ncbi:hypothetical protein GGI17_003474 [Coemansia sp. S146]|nr:hypothetical protein GGI17_003474 [Coemansia sp. S146]
MAQVCMIRYFRERKRRFAEEAAASIEAALKIKWRNRDVKEIRKLSHLEKRDLFAPIRERPIGVDVVNPKCKTSGYKVDINSRRTRPTNWEYGHMRKKRAVCGGNTDWFIVIFELEELSASTAANTNIKHPATRAHAGGGGDQSATLSSEGVNVKHPVGQGASAAGSVLAILQPVAWPIAQPALGMGASAPTLALDFYKHASCLVGSNSLQNPNSTVCATSEQIDLTRSSEMEIDAIDMEVDTKGVLDGESLALANNIGNGLGRKTFDSDTGSNLTARISLAAGFNPALGHNSAGVSNWPPEWQAFSATTPGSSSTDGFGQSTGGNSASVPNLSPISKIVLPNLASILRHNASSTSETGGDDIVDRASALSLDDSSTDELSASTESGSGNGASASASSTLATDDDSFDPFDFDFDVDLIQPPESVRPHASTQALSLLPVQAPPQLIAPGIVDATTEPSPSGGSAGRPGSGSGSGSKLTRRSPHSKQGSRFNPLSSSHRGPRSTRRSDSKEDEIAKMAAKLSDSWKAAERELGLEECEDYDFNTRAIIPAPSYEVPEDDHMAILVENMNLRSGPTASDHFNLASCTLQPLASNVNTNSAPATDVKSDSHSESKPRLPGSKKDRSKPSKKNDTTSSRQ